MWSSWSRINAAVYSVANVTIRALKPEDWELYRSIRTRAVTLDNGVYLAHPDEVKSRPDSRWIEDLEGQNQQIFGLFDGENIIGLCAVFTSRDDPSGQTGVMAMAFIEPDYRGRGYSSLLYKARIDFALKHQAWTTLTISHREGNEPSKRAMLKHGFELKDSEMIDWPDGTRDADYHYELNLEELRQGS